MGILTRQLGDPPKLPKVIGVAKMCSAVIFDRISMQWMICGSQESNAEYMKLVVRGAFLTFVRNPGWWNIPMEALVALDLPCWSMVSKVMGVPQIIQSSWMIMTLQV